jgi:hypothetical protein
MHIVHDNIMHIVHTRRDHTIISYIVPARHSIPVRDIECMRITYAQYCQMYARIIEVSANCNTIPSFRRLFHHHHTLLMGVLGVVLCPLRCPFIMVNGIIIVRIVQLTIAEKAQLGAAAAKVAMPIVHITEAHCAAIMQSQAHVGVVALAMAQDAVAPSGAFLIDMVSAVLLALTTIKPPLALTLPMVEHVLVVPLLGYASNGGIIDEGSTNSTTITPCRSSSVAIVGTVVVTSLVTSPYGMINMATIICGG